MRRTNKSPDVVDVHAGEILRGIRIMRGMSQKELADKCDVTFQQVQKYENGTNRMTISRLVKISKALNVNPMTFIDCS